MLGTFLEFVKTRGKFQSPEGTCPQRYTDYRGFPRLTWCPGHWSILYSLRHVDNIEYCHLLEPVYATTPSKTYHLVLNLWGTFIFLIICQSARPVSGPRCSLVLPWTVRRETPADWIIFAYLRVTSSESNTRIFAVIFAPDFSLASSIISRIRDQSSCMWEP